MFLTPQQNLMGTAQQHHHLSGVSSQRHASQYLFAVRQDRAQTEQQSCSCQPLRQSLSTTSVSKFGNQAAHDQ